MEKLNKYISKCAAEIKSRGLCEKGDEAHPAFLMIAVTEPAVGNVNISISLGGDGVRLAAAIASIFDNNPILANIFKAAMESHLINKMRAGVNCNTEC